MWVQGEGSGGLIVAVSTPEGSPEGPVTAYYQVPVGELRQSPVMFRLTDAPSARGEIRVYSPDCKLLDHAAAGSGEFKVVVSGDGRLTVSQYGGWGDRGPWDAQTLDTTPKGCPS